MSVSHKNAALDIPALLCYNIGERIRLPRSVAPKGIGVRKVRASQDRITDNVRRRRLPGKCNRKEPPQTPNGICGKGEKAR